MIYKELNDFQTGARVNAVMSPFAAPLTDQDMLDLAAYYSYLPRLPAYHPAALFPCRALSSRRAAAQYRALRRVPWGAGQQGGKSLA